MKVLEMPSLLQIHSSSATSAVCDTIFKSACRQQCQQVLTSCAVGSSNMHVYTICLHSVPLSFPSHSVVHNRCQYSQLTHCGWVTQICVFNTVKLGTSASSPQCHSTTGNFSRGITPSSTTRVFGEYFLKISVHKSSQRICYKFFKETV